MFRNDYDDSSGSPELAECDNMTIMTLPKKLQQERRADTAHGMKSARNEAATTLEQVVQETAVVRADFEENCPVIRANRIVFSSGRTGRTRVVFY